MTSAPTPELSDDALIAASARGDEDAFRVLVERHSGLVRGTVHRMLGNAEDAEDCAQQVFVKVWRAAASYKPDAKFTTWLLAITRNVVFSELRKKKIRALFSFQATEDPSTGKTPEDPPAPAHGRPDEAVLGSELGEAIREALALLPAKQRMALILHRFEQLPHEEVAKVLRVTVPSVKSLIFRARAELRATLEKRGLL